MEQEVLHLSIEVMREGNMFLKEYAYMSSHEVFVRTSIMREDEEETGWQNTGWRRLNGPDGNPIHINLDSLEVLAGIAARKGWLIQWNPAYDPGLKDFSVEVKF